MPDPGLSVPLYAALAGIAVLAIVARRVPMLRTALSLAGWLAMGALLVAALGQRERFDPYLARAARALGLEQQAVVGEEMRIRQSPDGHFWARVRIGPVERRLLIDSGATVTALSDATAAAAGLDPREGLMPVLLQTANGTVRARSASVAELRLGNIVARNLAVVVSPAFGDVNVLGMNFLSRLKSWRVEGTTLILVPHHPQAAPAA